MPQGSWLGPLMFLVIINDLTAACHIHKFVDDTTLTEVLEVHQDSRMQHNLDDIVSQSAASFININAKKTKKMQIGAGKRKRPHNRAAYNTIHCKLRSVRGNDRRLRNERRLSGCD